MTIIAGYVHSNHVWLGGDRLRSNGSTGHVYSEPKVFSNGDFLIGSCGSVRVAQLLKYTFKPPTPPEGEDILSFMVNDFVEPLRELLKERGVINTKDGEDTSLGSFLVGYQDRLFHIESDFQVATPNLPYCAAGSGEEYAEGAMFATWKTYNAVFRSEPDPSEMLESGLLAASEFSLSCALPFDVITNDANSFAFLRSFKFRE